MANDFLLSQIKGVSQNNKLNILNALPLCVKPTGTVTTFEVRPAFTLIYPDGTEESLSSGTNIASKFAASSEEQKYFIKDKKYSLPQITCGNASSSAHGNDRVYIKAEDLMYSDARADISRTWIPIMGNIGNVFKYGAATNSDATFKVRCGEFPVTGTAEDFGAFVSKLPNITELSKGTSESGTFMVDLDQMAAKTNCKLSGINGPNNQGDIYAFVQKARLNSRETGSLLISYFDRENWITVNGADIPDEAKLRFGRFDWTANTITLSVSSNGSTYTTYQTWNI